MSIASRAVNGTALLALLPITLAANPATAASADASAVQRTAKTWVLRTVKDPTVVASVFNGSTTDGSTVVLFPFHGGNHQKWEMIPEKGGWFQLKDLNAGKCLTNHLDGVGDHALLTMYTCQNLAGQLWAQVSIENTGTSTLVNNASGKCMDQGKPASAGGYYQLDQFGCTGTQSELWKITAPP
ncbi:RICIN domain-containing protein [Streptomyces sp. PRKS01-29]|nr:RICIN domain-containing protein [Streptomyces sabulosicollis]MBI0295184.1 RICIN domain-containing protein [Streptomyces sabulosicollis]